MRDRLHISALADQEIGHAEVRIEVAGIRLQGQLILTQRLACTSHGDQHVGDVRVDPLPARLQPGCGTERLQRSGVLQAGRKHKPVAMVGGYISRVGAHGLFEVGRGLDVRSAAGQQIREIAVRFGKVRLDADRLPKLLLGSVGVALRQGRQPERVVGARQARVERQCPLQRLHGLAEPLPLKVRCQGRRARG